jgi:hypothetical protein
MDIIPLRCRHAFDELFCHCVTLLFFGAEEK